MSVKRGDAGIFTAEGNVAGGRAAKLAAEREKGKTDFEARKKAIEVCVCAHLFPSARCLAASTTAPRSHYLCLLFACPFRPLLVSFLLPHA